MFFFLILFLLAPLPAGGQIYKYTDEQGSTHFADSLDKIPAPYRKHIQTIPGLNRQEKRLAPPDLSMAEKLLVGRWEYQGSDSGAPYTVIMSLRPKGVFDGNGFKKTGEKTLVWMFKGAWKVADGDLVLTYSWSSTPEIKRGTAQADKILQINEEILQVKSGRTGEVIQYTRK